MNTPRTRTFAGIITVLLVGVATIPVSANHAWSIYHWARGTSSFTLQLGDNVSSTWDANLALASSDWTQSSVLDTTIRPGLTTPRSCRPTSGRVEVCNYRYGPNGWLGIASVWVNASGHITQGTARMNDTYFSTARYNTTAWKNFVLCQEVGHTFGLSHQDENFSNAPLGSCMDYTSDPTPNQHPNQHDYDQLASIYGHLDAFTTVRTSLAGALFAAVQSEDHAEWGRLVKESRQGRGSLYEKNLGNGEKVFTFVIWADEAAGEHGHE